MTDSMISLESDRKRSAIIRRQPLEMFGIHVDNLGADQALNAIAGFLHERTEGTTRTVFFANVHTIHLGKKKKSFLEAVKRADLMLPDGIGLRIAGKMSGVQIRENLNGTDFVPKLLEMAQRERWSVYLFGSKSETIVRCRKSLEDRYPRLTIAGCSGGFLGGEKEHALLRDIRAKRPDILLVGLGSPLQEEWIVRNARSLQAGVGLAVGGLFDFLAGRFRRAPLWMRRLGLEWLYRFFQDPKTKWERVFVEIPDFLITVVLRALAPKKNPGPSR